jgi:hypothetical protein
MVCFDLMKVRAEILGDYGFVMVTIIWCNEIVNDID